ncbi:MAG: hypothetical protein IPM56_03430 [Ignavibacteriales bacterium]|nr:MAG: hypothetical protein IPM56_03430 [Ignavibacteriales bacterium]
MNNKKMFYLSVIYFVTLIAAFIYAGNDPPEKLKAKVIINSALLVWEAPAVTKPTEFQLNNVENISLNNFNNHPKLKFSSLEKSSEALCTVSLLNDELNYVHKVVSESNSGVGNGGKDKLNMNTGKR